MSETRAAITPASRLQIIVFGYMIRMPLGGLCWHYLQFAFGLAELGHDVYYLEDGCFFEEDDAPWFYNPETRQMSSAPEPGMGFATAALRETPLEDKWALYDASSETWNGPAAGVVPDLCRSADLLLNVSAANPVREPFLQIPRRVFLDTDPTFSQVRILSNPYRKALAERHNRFFTFGENVGTPRSSSPTAGLHWQPTRQPIVLGQWPVTVGRDSGKFTTLLAWDSFKYEESDGVRYGMKSESFQAILDLPRRTAAEFELGMFDPTSVPDSLRDHGWIIVDGQAETRSPQQYQDHVRRSKAEFSVAKHGYVRSRCGWFSDRSATYLASGRPVVLQDTGFSDVLQTGLGLLSYETVDEAQAAIEDVNARYGHHCRAARAVAEEYFDSAKVLTKLIQNVE